MYVSVYPITTPPNGGAPSTLPHTGNGAMGVVVGTNEGIVVRTNEGKVGPGRYFYNRFNLAVFL